MALDRTTRSLSSLGGASSSRVLNLAAIARAQSENEEHRLKPFFHSAALNSSIILKHRLRSDETDSFSGRRALVTKVIIPFDRYDLRAGGRSFFIGQRGYDAIVQEVGSYREGLDMKRDLDVLHLVDAIPSLDPFLLREQLRSSGYSPDTCYFSISDADQQRMFDYTATEVSRLTLLVTSGMSGTRDGASNKLVSALLSTDVDEKLEPLRMTLNLDPAEFCEGVFSWRGFLYYKWNLGEFWPLLIKSLREMKAIRPSSKTNSDQDKFFAAIKKGIIKGVKSSSDEVRNVLSVYDNAYASLVQRNEPKVFRDFLLGAPSLFLEMGEKSGAMSHVASFWQYRFSSDVCQRVDVEELTAIFEDFARSLGLAAKLAD